LAVTNLCNSSRNIGVQCTHTQVHVLYCVRRTPSTSPATAAFWLLQTHTHIGSQCTHMRATATNIQECSEDCMYHTGFAVPSRGHPRRRDGGLVGLPLSDHERTRLQLCNKHIRECTIRSSPYLQNATRDGGDGGLVGLPLGRHERLQRARVHVLHHLK
jgi:hypothetical protein